MERVREKRNVECVIEIEALKRDLDIEKPEREERISLDTIKDTSSSRIFGS